MPYFTDETKFTLPAASPVKEETDEGWVEYGQQDGYSLQSREITKARSSITQYRKVKLQ